MGTAEVYAGDIGHSYLKIAKFVVFFSLKRTWDGIKFMWSGLRFVFVWLIYSIQAMPVYLFIVIVAILVCVLWNTVLKPLCEYIIMGINGVIMGWNKLADGLEKIGVTGTPRGDEVSATIPFFVPFVMNILVPMLFKPLRNSLTGIIFAEDE